MFKTVLLLAAVVGLGSAQNRLFQQSRTQGPEITNLRSEADNKGDGTFSWLYENSDGSRQEQNGYIKNPQEPEPDNRIQVIQGSYTYYSPEGTPITITYVADENGFQPQGDALPTSPPIPEAIQKSLDIIYRNAEAQRSTASQQQLRPQQPFRQSLPRRF